MFAALFSCLFFCFSFCFFSRLSFRRCSALLMLSKVSATFTRTDFGGYFQLSEAEKKTETKMKNEIATKIGRERNKNRSHHKWKYICFIQPKIFIENLKRGGHLLEIHLFESWLLNTFSKMSSFRQKYVNCLTEKVCRTFSTFCFQTVDQKKCSCLKFQTIDKIFVTVFYIIKGLVQPKMIRPLSSKEFIIGR